MSDDDRQRIVRVPGSRRVRLTPAPGTTAEPGTEATDADPSAGPNDERMLRDVPPHY